MFIQTEETHDPSTLRFLPGRQVLLSGIQEFARPEDADDSPLAERLFGLGPVRTVILETDRIAITQAVHRGDAVLREELEVPSDTVRFAGDSVRCPSAADVAVRVDETGDYELAIEPHDPCTRGQVPR